MKKLIYILFLTTSVTALGQSNSSRIKELKTAYITQQLELTTSEARKFWPIYDEYYRAVESYRKDQMMDRFLRDDSNKDDLTVTDAKQIINDYTTSETAIYKAKSKLVGELEKVISDIKIAKLLIAEKDFNKQMLQRFRNRN